MDCKVVFLGQPSSNSGKSDYYREGFNIVMKVVNIQAFIIFVLSVVLAFYLGTQENHDRYIAETGDGKAMRLSPLSYPNMGRDALSDWVVKSASEIMTFGFNDVNERFEQSRHDFTAEGWEDFRKAMALSNFIDSMVQAQQILTTVPESPPVLKQEGMINGRYSWIFDVPLLVTFRAGATKVSRQKTAHIVVERIPTRENPSGVGISAWNIY